MQIATKLGNRPVGRIAAKAGIVLALLVGPSSDVGAHPVGHNGFASVYNRGVMERVARNRKMTIVNCMIATPLYKIGTWVTVRSRVTGKVRRCRVTDVPQPRHMKMKFRTKEFVEFNAGMSMVMCAHPYPGYGPRRSCPIWIGK